MTYSNGEVYDRQWQDDLRHGYGNSRKLEKYWFFRKEYKYYGYWYKGKKEGEGYYYYTSNGKIYLEEWHDDVPRFGKFTDVDDERIKNINSEINPLMISVFKRNSIKFENNWKCILK